MSDIDDLFTNYFANPQETEDLGDEENQEDASITEGLAARAEQHQGTLNALAQHIKKR